MPLDSSQREGKQWGVSSVMSVTDVDYVVPGRGQRSHVINIFLRSISTTF